MENNKALELINEGILKKGCQVKMSGIKGFEEFTTIDDAYEHAPRPGEMEDSWVVVIINGRTYDVSWVTEIKWDTEVKESNTDLKDTDKTYSLTPQEAIEAIRSNWPSAQYTILREALNMAIDALQNMEAPKHQETDKKKPSGIIRKGFIGREQDIPTRMILGMPYKRIMTNREVHEQAAGMGLDDMFFKINGIDPDAEYIPIEKPVMELTWDNVFNSQTMWPADYNECVGFAKMGNYKYLAFNGSVFSVDDVDMKNPICNDQTLHR